MANDPSSPDSAGSAPFLVTGGTGTLGAAVADRLVEAGHPVRVLSRRPRSFAAGSVEWVTGDLTTGAGAAEATDGVRAVIHCATTMGRKDVRATQVLADAARSSRGAPPHLVYISIVGVDRVPFFYYRAKLDCEDVVRHAQLPWTILRTTQFHDLVARMTTAQRRLPVTFVLGGTFFQPVDKTEVAARLAGLAEAGPAGRVDDLAGPRVLPADGLARSVQRAYGIRGPVVPVRPPGKLFRAYREAVIRLPTGPRAGSRSRSTCARRRAETGEGDRRPRWPKGP